MRLQKMGRRLIAAVSLLLAFILSSCMSPMPEQRIEGHPVAERMAFGTVAIRVAWPERPLAKFSAQAIPLRSNCIRLTTRNRQGTIVDRRALARTGNLPAATSSLIVLPSDSGYHITAEAFAEISPTADSAPIAQGNAPNVTIEKSKITAVPLTLTAVDAPIIDSMTPDNGGIGRSITILGRNFGASQNLPFRIRLNGVECSNPQRIDDSTLTAEVPPGAGSGRLVIEVDGVSSASYARFEFIKRISLTPFAPIFLTKQSRTVAAEVSDPSGSLVAHPSLSWTLAPAGLATIDANGLLTSLGDLPATLSVTASSGIASDTLQVVLWPRPVQVTVTPSSGTLNAQDPTGINDPGFVTSLPVIAVVRYSDDSTDSAVVWRTSDPTLGYYSNGRIFSALDAPAGRLILTATATRDGLTSGEAAFDITTKGKAEVVIQ